MRSSADTSVIELYHQAEDDFFVAISQLYRQFGSSLSAYCTGVEASSLNLLLVKQADPELASQLAQGIDFLQRTQMPFCVVVRDTLVAQVHEQLQQQQLLASDQTTCMHLDLTTWQAAGTAPGQVDIRCTDQHLEDWSRPVASAFESGEEGIGQYLARHRAALAAGRSLRHFSLYVEQVPVCSLTLSLGPGVARLDDIGTQREYQHRGYASALIQHALAYAKVEGARCCVLEASIDGLSIYRRAGFATLFEYTTFCRE
ncbi:GNAT family N-acetyltransferase [Pseudomonas sp. CF161]|jgi:ribosomal protein S18 acetylase RimI-like enzyme|uniref:GNAT family N-acetyltransferase n=1 Tax=Pseudomonas sp. CF161 TaxID=911241 RepID=UPI000355159A|nr:GNAT family N-acetyltransferase [Pseudomonas sp. CF161]EPL08723.1 acetyltransferase [Pseudomonas sp. CF161]